MSEFDSKAIANMVQERMDALPKPHVEEPLVAPLPPGINKGSL